MALPNQASENNICPETFARSLARLVRDLFGEAFVDDAMAAWNEGDFSNKFRTFHLRKYSIRFCQNISRPDMADSFYSGLYALFMEAAKEGDTQGGVPNGAAAMQMAPAQSKVVPLASDVGRGSMDDSHVIFESFVGAIVENAFSLKIGHPNNVDGYGLVSDALRTTFKRDLRKIENTLRWLSSGVYNAGLDLSEKELCSVFHNFYIEMCNYFGPVSADKYVKFAIKSVETKPEAMRFHPKKFL